MQKTATKNSSGIRVIPDTGDYSYHFPGFLKNSSIITQPFDIYNASLPWFFIGYWILKRGWVSTRPLFFCRYHPWRVLNPPRVFITLQELPKFQNTTTRHCSCLLPPKSINFTPLKNSYAGYIDH
jgi:hypothetical protein